MSDARAVEIEYPDDALPQTWRQKNMDSFDALPPALRQCVHEYGFPIIAVLFQHGVTKATVIHQIVREVWDGPRGYNKGPMRNGGSGPEAVLDWLLMNSGSNLHAQTLARALWERGYAIVPRDPSPGMIEASKQTVSQFNQVVTKSEKHRKRLRAAVEQYVSANWLSVGRR